MPADVLRSLVRGEDALTASTSAATENTQQQQQPQPHSSFLDQHSCGYDIAVYVMACCNRRCLCVSSFCNDDSEYS